MNDIYVWILLGIMFGVFALFGTVIRVASRHRIDLVDWFTLAFALFNGFSFSFILWMTYNGQNDWSNSQWILGHKNFYGAYLLSGLIFLLSTWIGASLLDKGRIKKSSGFREITDKNSLPLLSRMAKISWVMLFIAIASYFIYVKGYGGYGSLLKYAPFIRSGHFELIPVSNPWTFLERFGSFAFFSSFVFFGLALSNVSARRFKALNIAGFIVSFSLSILVLYARLGRLSLVAYLVIFPIGYWLFRYKISFRTIILLIAISSLTIFVLVPLANSLLKRGSSSTGIGTFYASQMSFTYISFFAQMDAGQYRYMKDVLLSTIDILPDRIFKNLLHLDSASDVNTARIKGAVKGQDGVSGEVPIDILTFSFMEGGILGLLILGIIWGAILMFVEIFINKILSPVREMLYVFSIINISVLTIPYGDPRHFFVENLYFVVGVAAFYIFGAINIKREIGAESSIRSCPDNHILPRYGNDNPC
ncbi:hypothetical protein [Caldisericum sp.]|jgi:hypothetical protein|uniref:hypothetical protein n=1 Tax=Caldisericum sp. TaxID=2499687 RepID=UPI003D118495